MFCVDLRTNSDYFATQHELTGFYNRDGVCLLRGTDWSLYIIRVYIKIYVLPTQCIYVFCMDLRTNSHYFPTQHGLTGFYNWDGECLLRGTDWGFNFNSDCIQAAVLIFFMYTLPWTKGRTLQAWGPTKMQARQTPDAANETKEGTVHLSLDFSKFRKGPLK